MIESESMEAEQNPFRRAAPSIKQMQG